MKFIRRTNDINDDIVRKSLLFPTKDAKKNLQKGYDMTIIFGERIEGSSDNVLLMGRFYGITSNNDDVGKSLLKEIIVIHLKVGKKALIL